MYYVYFLKNNSNKIYLGFSADLKQRIKSHNWARVKSTKRDRPWKLIYYEAFLSKEDAILREKTLKNYGSSLGQLKKRLTNSLNL